MNDRPMTLPSGESPPRPATPHCGPNWRPVRKRAVAKAEVGEWFTEENLQHLAGGRARSARGLRWALRERDESRTLLAEARRERDAAHREADAYLDRREAAETALAEARATLSEVRETYREWMKLEDTPYDSRPDMMEARMSLCARYEEACKRADATLNG